MSNQFHSASTKSGKVAFEAYCAIYFNGENEVAISAPTLAQLEVSWERIVGTELKKDIVQHVWIVKAE